MTISEVLPMVIAYVGSIGFGAKLTERNPLNIIPLLINGTTTNQNFFHSA